MEGVLNNRKLNFSYPKPLEIYNSLLPDSVSIFETCLISFKIVLSLSSSKSFISIILKDFVSLDKINFSNSSIFFIYIY